ncbi:MAG: Na+/H+ antiporter NhaC [Rikenellaceae bacterium]|nr:Na+/H+ antiporter NhaC [Rikenellaceae bacterium]
MKKPTVIQAFIPIITLLVLIALNVLIAADDTMAGANQLSLLLAAFVGGALAIARGASWDTLVGGISRSFTTAVPAMLILLMVGALSGSWMTSGIIPTMIYYGLEVLRPEFFLPATVIITVIISVATGSSWSTVATIGVALIAVGNALGIDPAWSAGAIISGAYFGDKVSPLSDTTNLAATVGEVELFDHIRFMMRTTIPSILLTLVVFTIMGLRAAEGDVDPQSVGIYQQAMADTYCISGWLMLIPLLVVVLIARRVPAVPVLMIGTLVAVAAAALFQQPLLTQLAGEPLTWANGYDTLTRCVYGTTEPSTGLAVVDDLVSTGGMMGMMNTIWLIISAMIFAGVMDAGGFIESITDAMLRRMKSRAPMVTATTASCLLFNLTTGDQYMSIVIPGKMFQTAFKRQGYDPCLLTRTLEDGATATSVLIPWNTCGATQAAVLGVATAAYLPFAFFCWLSPLMTVLFAWFGIAQTRRSHTERISCRPSSQK